MSQIQVTLKKSRFGRVKKHNPVLEALGLRKINQSRIFQDTPQIRGMIDKVSYLVEVQEIQESK